MRQRLADERPTTMLVIIAVLYSGVRFVWIFRAHIFLQQAFPTACLRKKFASLKILYLEKNFANHSLVKGEMFWLGKDVQSA
jgi:hypothetical protein